MPCASSCVSAKTYLPTPVQYKAPLAIENALLRVLVKVLVNLMRLRTNLVAISNGGHMKPQRAKKGP